MKKLKQFISIIPVILLLTLFIFVIGTLCVLIKKTPVNPSNGVVEDDGMLSGTLVKMTQWIASSTDAIITKTANKTVRITGDLEFQDEIKPDGALCSDGQILKKTGADNWDCATDDSGAGATVFTGLTDTPANYTGQSGNCTAVNGAEDALEFVACGSGGGSMTTVKENGSQLGGADIITLDFLGADFNLTETPDTEINITINDGGINHDSLLNFVANEHLDWTSDLGATNIHAGNYTTLTNLTDFDQTAWRLFYSNNLGNVVELSLGTDGQYLKSQGGTSTLTWGVPTNTTYTGGTNLTLAGTTFNVDDAFIKLTGDITGALTSDLNIDANTLVVDYDTNEVGIGVADPLARLHVNYPASGDVIFQAGTGDGGADMDLKYGYNGYGWYNTYLGSGSGDGNEWQLWSEGMGSTDMQVYGAKQSGNIQFMKMVSLSAGTSVNDIDITVANNDNALITSGGVFDGLAGKQALDATLTDIADGTINENLINTANPWADNEVSNTLTVSGYMQDTDIDTFAELQSWAVGYTDNNTTYVSSDFTHDDLTGFVANEHLDWTSDLGATNIHAGNYTDTNTTYTSSDWTLSDITGYVANEHINWTADQGATNIHSGNYTDTNTTYTAGRSLTLDGTTINADSELYHHEKCIYFEDPVADDDFKSLFHFRKAATITGLWGESDQTVNAMLQIDDGTPADIDSVDLVCDSTPADDTSLNGDTSASAGDRLDLVITSVSGAPTWVSICVDFTYND